MSGSHVHKKWLAVQREMFEGAPRELEWLSKIWWACHYISLCNTLDRLPAIKKVLEEVEERNGDRSVEHKVCLHSWIWNLLCKIFGEYVAVIITWSFKGCWFGLWLRPYLSTEISLFFDGFWTEDIKTAAECKISEQPKEKKANTTKFTIMWTLCSLYHWWEKGRCK